MLRPGGQYKLHKLHTNAAGAEDGLELDCTDVSDGSYTVLTLQIVGIGTATITFEGTIDLVTWAAIPGVKQADQSIATTATADGLYRVPVTGLVKVRARISSYSSGAIYVYGVMSSTGDVGVKMGGVSDHGDLTGLGDDDHTQYLLKTSYTLLDTRANILATSPATRQLAFATDTLELFYWTGAAWYVAPLELDAENTTPDMGAYNSDGLGVSDRQGYYSNVITDKVLHHVVIGHNDRTETGGLRVSGSELQAYLSAAWNTIVTGFRFQQDSSSQVGELEFRPSGYSNYYGVMNGNSDVLGLNALPLVQQYQASMGIYAAKVVVEGGTF